MGVSLSIVVPLYNEEDLIPELFKRFSETLASFAERFSCQDTDVEVILVNDGSTDTTLAAVRTICLQHPSFKLLNLSRNYGHQLAITAGIDHASGEHVVVIDGDLQDPPEFILNLYEKAQAGYDVVYAKRDHRSGESFFKRVTAKLFYRLLSRLTPIDIPLDTGDFRLMSRRVVTVLKDVREQHRFIRGLVSWAGFQQIGLPYQRDARFSGKTKFSLGKMCRFALDGISSFSVLPLQLILWLGFVTAFLGFVGALLVIYLKVMTDVVLQGWSSLMVVMLFLGGIQLICIGIIGEYVGRIHDEVKKRPLYVVEGLYES